MSDPVPQPAQPAFGTFVGEINQQSVGALTTALSVASQSHVPAFHLLMQSGGGGVAEGVFLYNLFRNFPVPITTYNVGSIQSAAVVAFLGAPRRVASRYGSFMIHRPQSAAQGADLATLAAATVSLGLDDARMEAILREHLTLQPEKWEMYNRSPLWIGAADALAGGLISEIGEFSPPAGAPVYAFG